MKNKTEKFFQKIFDFTNQKKLKWHSLFDYSEFNELSELKGYNNLINITDVHEFDYVKSFISVNENFVILLLHESYKPISKYEFNLYLSKDINSTPERLNISESKLLDLFNLLISLDDKNLNLSLDSEKIIDDFLSDSF